MSDSLRILAVLGLVAANAFFVIGEYAVVTARRARLAARAEAGHAGARAALRLMDDPVRVISTVQVGITAVGILTGAIGEPLVRDLLGDALPSWLSFLLAFGLITYLSVVLGELVPKALTLARAEALAALVAPAIELISKLLRPLVIVLQASARLLLKPFGVDAVVAGDTVASADELRLLVDEAEGAGVIPRAQEELLHNVFDFAGREAADVMVPAPDVVWLEAAMHAQEALDRALEAGHSRYPVARQRLDHVVGVVHVRELVRVDPDAPVEGSARPAYVVPETKDLGALLRELRERREQIAIVADEYGGTAGLVTLEDVVEELVGEIQDEFDLPDETLTRLDEQTVEVAGSFTVDDFNDTLRTRLPTEPARTLAGLVFQVLGRRPAVGDEVKVEGVGFTVREVEGARIRRLRVRLPSEVG